MKLPRTLSLFAHKLGARYLGAPAYDEHFNVFAAPLAVELAAIGARVDQRAAFCVPLPTSSAA